MLSIIIWEGIGEGKGVVGLEIDLARKRKSGIEEENSLHLSREEERGIASINLITDIIMMMKGEENDSNIKTRMLLFRRQS